MCIFVLMKIVKVIRNIVIAVVALLLIVLVALQIVLRPAVLTNLVNKYAPEFVDADVSFGQIRAHVIKSFPYLNLEATDFALTYPHERYAQWDSIYPDSGHRFSLLKAGRGDQTDTLAAFRKLGVSFDYMGLLQGGEIHLKLVELDHPRIFAHYYDSTAANWNILPSGGGEQKEQKNQESTQNKDATRIIVNKIRMTGRPFVVFTNPRDTIHGMFTMRRLDIDGTIDTKHIGKISSEVAIDSLFISGRLPADTVAFALRSLRAKGHKRHLEMDASAHAWLATNSFGRLKVPINVNLDGDFPHRRDDSLELRLNTLRLEVSRLAMVGQGHAVCKDGIYDLDMDAHIKDFPLWEVMSLYQEQIPALKNIRKDASLSLDVNAKGIYGGGSMPVVNAVVPKLYLNAVGAKINASGSAMDVLGEDPLITLDATAHARVDSLTKAFTLEKGITGTGKVDAKLHGKLRKSHLNMKSIGKGDILCNLKASNLSVNDAPDSISANIPGLELELQSKANTIDRNLPQGARVLALKAQTDTLSAEYGNISLNGKDVLILMQNSADILKGGKDLSSFMGIAKLGALRLKDHDGMSIRLRDNTETFRITPASKSLPVPKYTLRSSSGRIGIRNGMNFFALKDVKLSMNGSQHQSRGRLTTAKRNHLLDSLQRVYPGVPRDSLFHKARMERLSRMPKDDFASADIKISLSKAFQSTARQWDVNGKVNLGGGRIMMPSFPLRTRISNVSGSFNNDTLDLKNLTIQAGESDLSARINLSGLRRAMMGSSRSHLKLKADVSSNFLDVNELMRGYAYYATYEPPQNLAEASDQAVEEEVDKAQLPDTTVSGGLLVLPSNLDVDFSLVANGIKYDSLLVSWAAADVAMRNRTLQITNTVAASNMGDLYFEGFYATRSKEDIKTGFDLNLVNITAEKVITLFPDVDTQMPMLKSFKGDLDMELAVTTELDTCMNLIIPSVDGVLKISGKDLSLKDSDNFTKIAKMLMFKDKSKARIDNMSVTGMMQDSRIDIFPFVIDVDRYQVAASGAQVLDQWLDYHISVIKSPLLIKFGINARGRDFDHIRFSLGRARYRNANVPVFTKQMDTVQYSLLAAIHNIFELGVEKAMEENKTAQYLSPAALVTLPEGETEEFSQEAVDGFVNFQEGILANASSKREAIKQDIIKLAKEYEQ